MRIINNTASPITFTDLDRGLDIQKSIYETFNGKADSGIVANGHLDVLDTEKVLLSAELGQIKKFKTAGLINTAYSITGAEIGTFVITGANNVFSVKVGTGSFQNVTLPAGTAVTMDTIVSTINASATGFTAEKSERFFRASNVDNITAQIIVDDDGHKNYGQRGVSIVDGFLALTSSDIITIGNGTANNLLGFHFNDFTKAK